MDGEASNTDQRDGISFSRWFRQAFCPCVPTVERKIAPLNATSPNTKFIHVGKKKNRRMRVLHLEPLKNGILKVEDRNNVKVPSALTESQDYDSDSSADEYWFTKWTLPFQTVKKLQRESLRRRNGGFLHRISTRLSSRRKSKRATGKKLEACVKSNISTEGSVPVYANKLANEIIADAKVLAVSYNISKSDVSTTVTASEGKGIANLAFMGTEANPDVVQTVLETNLLSANNQVSSMNMKPLLFFIHGAGESLDYWNYTTQYFLALDYEVVAFDFIGHGFSTAPRDPKYYTFAKLFQDALTVFDEHVSNGRKCILIGHGYGCSIAVKLSRQRSSNVSLMALLSSGGPTPLAPSFNWRSELKWSLSVVDCLRPLLSCGLKRRVLYGPRGKSSIYHTENVKSLPNYVVSSMARGQSWPEGDVAYHRKIHVPTLLVHGMKDSHVSLVEMCEMERTIPRAFLEVIPEAGHDIPADSPKELCKMMRKFFENWER